MKRLTPAFAADVFAISNLGFLGVDIALAHQANRYARVEEWLPVAFSAGATVLLAPILFGARMRRIAILVGVLSIALGIAGLIYHLRSGFFLEQTVRGLVYAAPFAAPLAYVGVGLLVLLSRLETPESPTWAAWILMLALGGFIGNFVLTLTDHAQNAFFSKSEWIAVGSAAFAVGFLAIATLRPHDRVHLRITLGVLAIQVVVGIAGAVLHWRGILSRPGPIVDRVIYGPPAFAPLLFADLALLAGIGMWSLRRTLR
jgi:hypothetical protein